MGERRRRGVCVFGIRRSDYAAETTTTTIPTVPVVPFLYKGGIGMPRRRGGGGGARGAAPTAAAAAVLLLLVPRRRRRRAGGRAGRAREINRRHSKGGAGLVGRTNKTYHRNAFLYFQYDFLPLILSLPIPLCRSSLFFDFRFLPVFGSSMHAPWEGEK